MADGSMGEGFGRRAKRDEAEQGGFRTARPIVRIVTKHNNSSRPNNPPPL